VCDSLPKESCKTIFQQDLSQRPVINLKKLNSFVPYEHFKMEGLFLIKEIMQKGDFLCKLDLKDAYFSVPLHQESRKFVRFEWKRIMYPFLDNVQGHIDILSAESRLS